MLKKAIFRMLSITFRFYLDHSQLYKRGKIKETKGKFPREHGTQTPSYNSL